MNKLSILLHRIQRAGAAGQDRLFLFLHKNRIRLLIGAESLALALLLLGWASKKLDPAAPAGLFSGTPLAALFEEETDSEETDESFIKWVDFHVTSEAMTQAFRYDVSTCQQEPHLNWVELLAYLGAVYGGDFSHYSSKDMDKLAQALQGGKTMAEMTEKLPHYSYYLEAYGAVLNGMVGYYEIEIPKSEAPEFALQDSQLAEGSPDEPDNQSSDSSASSEQEQQSQAEGQADTSGGQSPTSESQVTVQTPTGEPKVWVTKYGLKAFHPLAKNFPYSHYDDFGVSRSYGYKRQHLGHDMMGQVGTPVIAVESGYVEALGWNQYGGWRIGIRSFDNQRYYYYAHLRKDYPYQSILKEGSIVTAGDVIGYLGRTGYSATENTNNIDEPHLHFGLQLIFDESQKEGNGEIWIDCYELIKFLSINRSESVKVDGTKEWTRIYQMTDPSIPSPSPTDG